MIEILRRYSNMVEGNKYSPPKINLPLGYTLVQYIENTKEGGSIDTGIKIEGYRYSLYLDYSLSSFWRGKLAAIMGYGNYTFSIQISTNNKIYAYPIPPNSENILAFGTSLPNERHNILFNTPDGSFFDGYSIDKQYYTLKPSTNNLKLFTRSPNDTYFLGKIYRKCLYKEEEILIDYVPCIRDSDGAIGFYDQVNNKYINASKTYFIAGKIIEQ